MRLRQHLTSQRKVPSLLPQTVAHAVWLNFLFPLRLCLVEELLTGKEVQPELCAWPSR